MRTRPLFIMPAALVTVALAAASLGPDWQEGDLDSGEAGEFANSAQVPHGKPAFSPLDMISGNLEPHESGGGDDRDMYLVFVDDPLSFLASTDSLNGGSTTFNSQLWLFNDVGLGQLANDGTGDGATLRRNATDGTGFSLTTPGYYYLAISAFDSDPLGGPLEEPIFIQATPGEISGPDGPDGSMRHSAWSTGGVVGGSYAITLSGMVFVPCVGDVNNDGVVDVDDLTELLLAWGPCAPGPCPADIDDDGDVEVDDLVAVLLNWGQCNVDL